MPSAKDPDFCGVFLDMGDLLPVLEPGEPRMSHQMEDDELRL